MYCRFISLPWPKEGEVLHLPMADSDHQHGYRSIFIGFCSRPRAGALLQAHLEGKTLLPTCRQYRCWQKTAQIIRIIPLCTFCGVHDAHFPADGTESPRLHRSSVLVLNLKDYIMSPIPTISNYMIACFIRLRIYSYSSASFIWIR